MQRKPTKTTRGPNAEEKRYQSWLKHDCGTCGACGLLRPLIVHHCMGSTYKHKKQLIGHWFCAGICEECDSVITRGSRREFKNKFGLQSEIWRTQAARYMRESGNIVPLEIYDAIIDSGE